MQGEFRFEGNQVIAELRDMSQNAQRKAVKVVRQHTQLLETDAKQNASGRPGPNVITGDYRRSITSEVQVEPGLVRGIVGTANVQGPRLEFGFVGTDALGRVYNQPPYPHFRPALAAREPEFIADMENL